MKRSRAAEATAARHGPAGHGDSVIDDLLDSVGKFSEEDCDAISFFHPDEFEDLEADWPYRSDPIEREKVDNIVGRYFKVGILNGRHCYRQEPNEALNLELFCYYNPEWDGWIVSTQLENVEKECVWARMPADQWSALPQRPSQVCLPFWKKVECPLVGYSIVRILRAVVLMKV